MRFLPLFSRRGDELVLPYHVKFFLNLPIHRANMGIIVANKG